VGSKSADHIALFALKTNLTTTKHVSVHVGPKGFQVPSLGFITAPHASQRRRQAMPVDACIPA
jgi:hypothetical protein